MIRLRSCEIPALLFGVLGLGACAVGPDYEAPPTADDDVAWSLQTAAVTMADPDGQWWLGFEDPELTRLIDTALGNNHDIRQALERIAEARALRDRVAGRRYPSLAAAAGVNRRRLSENGALPAGRIPGLETYQTIYDVGFDASWEIDVFGRTRGRIAAADADLDRTIAERADIALSIAAEVARNYLELRGAQAELAAQRRAVSTGERTLALVETRQRVGEVPAMDVARAKADLAAAEAGLPAIEAQVRIRALALAALTGREPQAELALLAGEPRLAGLDAIPIGQRADLLRRRADVRIAERRLAAASANERVASAELFPKLVIGAAGGFESLQSGSLFDSASTTWSIVPQVSWRIFDGGRVRAEIRASEARVRQAALGYEQAVIAALTDAEQSLTRYHYALEQLDRQRDSVAAAEESYRLSNARYEVGEVSLLSLLDAERALATVELALARAHAGAATSLVALYKSLGGRWQEDGSSSAGAVGQRGERIATRAGVSDPLRPLPARTGGLQATATP
jgi:NodT family efflux transporter outer membrane factor (OMF) lipoprotein